MATFRRPILAAVAALGTGCGEKAVELRLRAPAGADAAFDVSCVNQIEVNAWQDDETYDVVCVEVPRSPTSLADLVDQIRGRVELEMPDDLIAIQIYARASETPSLCESGDAIFYAGADVEGDVVNLPIVGTLDCGVRAASSERTVRLIDFRALAATPPGSPPTCTAPPGVTYIEAGVMFGSNLSEPMDPAYNITWQYAVVDAGGRATVPVWTSTLGTSCPVVLTLESDYEDANSCAYPGAPTLCATAGEVEVPIIEYESASVSFDESQFSDGVVGVVLGGVWDATTKRPIAGATITLDDPDAGTVVYGSWVTGAARFEPIAGTATNAGGLFALYAGDPVRVTVSSPAHRPRELVLGATVYTGGSAIVALSPL